MPFGDESRQRHCDLSVAADAGNCGRCAGGHLFQLSRGGGGKSREMQRLCCTSKTPAWRSIFWVSLPPGVLFVLGSLLVTESPRWLFRRGSAIAPSPRCCARALLSRPRSSSTRWSRSAQAVPAKHHRGSRESLLQEKVRDSLSAGLRDSGVQHGYGRQLDHWLQRRHPDAERIKRPERALGLCAVHCGEFCDDGSGHGAG